LERNTSWKRVQQDSRTRNARYVAIYLECQPAAQTRCVSQLYSRNNRVYKYV
jgi:hypothetical protein